MPGPRSAAVIAGAKCNTTGFMMPSIRSQVGAISIASHVDNIKVVFSLDKAVMQDPCTLVNLFAKNLDEQLATDLQAKLAAQDK